MMPEPASVLLDFALRYAALGWPSFPVRFKAPITTHGVKDASVDPRVLEFRFSDPTATGVGIAVGFPVPGMPGYHCEALDIDPRNGGDITLEGLVAAHGALPDTICQQTGGGGTHYLLAVPDGQRLKACGKGIDIKRLGGYILAEPSLHPNGNSYTFQIDASPFHGCPIGPAPAWLLETATADVVQLHVSGRGYLAPERVEDLRSALGYLDPDDYHQWVQVGQALHSTEAGEPAFQIWQDWSERSTKFKSGECQRKWVSFRPGKGLNVESIFHWAQQAGWVAADNQPIPIEQVAVAFAPEPERAPAPSASLPGVLGEVEAWINATSRKPQPMFATQIALAFGATVLGRRYVSAQRNWPSLYFLNIGKSASGKEHGKWALEHLLEACDLGNLIGPPGYTSDSGVLSGLHMRPSHVAIVDEFGKVLEAASVKGNVRATAVMRQLMEVWGRCDGTIRPQGYSTVGMKAADVEKLEARTVRNPALTLLALTTPDTFFDSIGSASARDGFLNRFLIVESDIGRQAGHHVAAIPVPDSIRQWAIEARGAPLVNPDMTPHLAAAPIEIPITGAARAAFQAFSEDCIALMDRYEDDGLAEMFGRSGEMAMRLALIIAVSCRIAFIDVDHAQWAIDYVRHHAIATADRLKASVADSEFAAVKKQVLAALLENARRNPHRPHMAPWEIAKKARLFDRMDKRGQVAVLESLQYLSKVENVQVATTSGRGKPASAWVATQEPRHDAD